MDPKRKKLYIILIIVCLVLAAGILLWGQFSSPSVPSEQPLPIVSSDTATPAVDSSSGAYPAPAVFPAKQTFDSQVLDSSAYKTLAPYQPASVSASELGRDDPFKSY